MYGTGRWYGTPAASGCIRRIGVPDNQDDPRKDTYVIDIRRNP